VQTPIPYVFLTLQVKWPYDTLTIEIFDRQWNHQSTVSVNHVFGDADPDFYNTQINFFFADGDTLIICGTNIFENGCEYFTEAYSVSNDSILWSNTQYIDCEAWLFCNFYFDDSYRKSGGNLIYSVNAPFFTGYSSWLLRLSIDGQVDTLRENSTGNFERNFGRLLNHNGIVYTLNHYQTPGATVLNLSLRRFWIARRFQLWSMRKLAWKSSQTLPLGG